jgi:hypothetical protein
VRRFLDGQRFPVIKKDIEDHANKDRGKQRTEEHVFFPMVISCQDITKTTREQSLEKYCRVELQYQRINA